MIPTSTNLSVTVTTRSPANIDAIAVFLHKQADPKHPQMQRIPADLREAVQKLRSIGAVTGKTNELAVQVIDGKPPRRLLVVGLGNIEVFSCECLREAGAVVARAARKLKLRRVALIVPPLPGQMPGRPEVEPAGNGIEVGPAALATGLMLANFDWSEYRGKVTRKKHERQRLDISIVVPDDDLKRSKPAVERAVKIAEAQNMARTIAFRPGNDINPPSLAELVKKIAKEVGLACRVLDEKEMKRLGMGGILAVGGGSNRTPPRMIVLEHSIANRKSKIANPLLLVGKGITFDTGGLSIKPTASMRNMVFDKCGAMAVLGAMVALARLKAPVNVVGILACAENHISATSYRPGDLLRMYNGVTVEVTDTDAEGRLVLADALAWGIEQFKPAAVVDLATLTGGVVTALGTYWAGLMSNNDALATEIARCGDRVGEKTWRLPLSDEVNGLIKSETADIVNAAGRHASPLQGGAFLSYFLDEDRKTPWVHLDIAGVADAEKELPYYGKGATGWGVRTLVEWVSHRSTKPA